MMAFGMVVIAGIVGSGGLGGDHLQTIRTLDIAKSIDAAIAIVIPQPCRHRPASPREARIR